jgi:hypothetical protein
MFFMSVSAVAICYGQSTGAQVSIHDAYNTLIQADNAGVDISSLTEQLNQAINLTTQAQTLTTSTPNKQRRLVSKPKRLQRRNRPSGYRSTKQIVDEQLAIVVSVVAC